MDPLTAFSLACNILTAVEAAVKAAQAIKQLYDTGRTRDGQLMLDATATLERTLRGLEEAGVKVSQATHTDPIRQVSLQYNQVSIKANEILDKCRPKKKSFFASVMAFRRGIAAQSDIKRLQSELESCAKDLSAAMAIATLAYLGRLTELIDQANLRSSNASKDLTEIKEALKPSGNGSNLLAEIEKLRTTSEEALAVINQRAILRSIRPDSADTRFNEIRDREPDTFDWIFESPEKLLRVVPKLEQHISTWLRSGSGIFHIVGKPGSGKSTLMKFLATHEKTRALLGDWAAQRDGKDVIISKFFFWKLGSGEQKTIRGLLRSLLYEALKEAPDMTRLLFPSHWEPRRYLTDGRVAILPEISDEDVRRAFELLKQEQEIREKFCLCFFIDGLDEFDEPDVPHHDLVARLRTLNWTRPLGPTSREPREELDPHQASLPDHIKMCVSSRDLPPITTQLSTSQRIPLHLLTRSDIEILVRARLEHNKQFQDIAKTESKRCRLLVEKIIDDTGGVFLWVTLLLKLLKDELSPGVASIDVLENIVLLVPTELEDFFGKIVGSIPKHHRRGAYFIFAMAARMAGLLISNRERSLGEWLHDKWIHSEYHEAQHACLSLVGLSTVMSALEKPPGDFLSHGHEGPICSDPEEYSNCQEWTQMKLSAWCRCLLEVEKAENVRIWGKTKGHLFARFTHRSVPEFLLETLRQDSGAYGISDNVVAELIMSSFLQEARAQRCLHTDVRLPLTRRLDHVFARLRQTPISDSGPLLPMLRAAEEELFYYCFGSNSPPASFWDSIEALRNWPEKTSALALAAKNGLYEFVQWKLDHDSPGTSKPGCIGTIITTTCSRRRCIPFSKFILKAALQTGFGANTAVPSNADGRLFYPWHEFLCRFLKSVRCSHDPRRIAFDWELLEIWLEFGAQVPKLTFTKVDLRSVSHMDTVITFPERVHRTRIGMFEYDHNFVDHFTTMGSATLADIVRYFKPLNARELLGRIEQNAAQPLE